MIISRRAAIGACLAVMVASWLIAPAAQNFRSAGSGSALPVGCTSGDIYFLTGSTTIDIRVCNASNQWTGSGSAIMVSGTSVPTGAIVFVASGACPSGYTEVAALNGRMMRGTVAAQGNVGGTGGSDTITPAGTNSAPALTMNSYTPAGTNAAITAGTPAGTNSTSATSGNCAATNLAIGTGALTACKATAPNLTVSAQTFTGSALATHTHTFTGNAATLTGSVAAPTFAGTQFDNRAAYINLIGCQKS